MAMPWVVMLLLLYSTNLYYVAGATNPQDVTVLLALRVQWKNTPPGWKDSDDPCDSKWEGVECQNSRVTKLRLSGMGLIGVMTSDLGQLEELDSLVLSFNKDLTGPLPPAIGKLKKLTTLLLNNCSFNGKIPDELGNLESLEYLALNSNYFIGDIPCSLGKLSKLFWFDIADNRLTGSLPVSTPTTPGLDQLSNAQHFHFSNNQLTGPIPSSLFNSKMALVHVLIDGNKLNGIIPSQLGLVKNITVLRLDRNNLSGIVPPEFSNLTKINELHLSNNQLTGPIPDLSAMKSLRYVDLSNNSFDPSEAPTWFTTIETLTTLVMERGSLKGPIPESLFNLPRLQQVILKKNAFNGTLDMDGTVSRQLNLVDLRDNNIAEVTEATIKTYSNSIGLFGNPVCAQYQVENPTYCQSQLSPQKLNSSIVGHCDLKLCQDNQVCNPRTCSCAYPYGGTMYFRAPSFSDLSNRSRFNELEIDMEKHLQLTIGSVYFYELFFNVDGYLQLQLEIFPPERMYFDRSEVQTFGFELTLGYEAPEEFGPYVFEASTYVFPDGTGTGRTSRRKNVTIAIAAGCVVLVMFAGLGIYALLQKKRAERAIESSKPFASLRASGDDGSGVPQLKGARWFSFDEIRKATKNFSDHYEIGSGGYGKVYKGILKDGEMVAIKRAAQGSKQGELEFKTEIELLSRVHHKNLVTLIGFCLEQGEQMLVYEYVPNGTLKEGLTGKSGIYLDWNRRLQIALGSAQGLSYLHELANPPIIHRDVKSANILLDLNLMAKVADFGLSKFVADSAKGHVSTQVKGTPGYMDPEYFTTQLLTTKSDVYSFGIVMLELVTAKQPIQKGNYIVRQVKAAMNKNEECCGLKEILDPAIRDTKNLVGFERFLEVSLKCIEESSEDRPTMYEVVKEIEAILKNDGISITSMSVASSTTELGLAEVDPLHPCIDPPPKADDDSNSFEYSGGYNYSAEIEPK